MAAHGAQVVQQRQQHERHVAPAAQHAFEIRRQLHHRAHQRVEAFGEMALLGEVVDQVARDLAHFLGEQRGAVDFGDAQRAVHRVQVLVALAQQRDVVLLLAERFERAARASLSSLASSRATICRVCDETSAMSLLTAHYALRPLTFFGAAVAGCRGVGR